MKKRVAYYVSRKNPLIWLAALVMLASAALRIANVCGKGADAKTVWFLVVLPVVGCVFYVLNILCNGSDRFYRSSVPVILLAIYYGIKITLVSPYLWLTFMFWIAYLAIAAFYAVTVSGHIKSTIPLLLLLIAALGILAGMHEKEFTRENWPQLRQILPDMLFLLAGILTLLGAKVYEWLFSFASGLLGKAPGIFLFVVTSVLASFMSSSELPALRELASRKLPERWRARLSGVLGHLKTSLGGWLRAQLKLMGIVFLLVTAGLMLLGVDYPLLFGLVIAIVDALPVFGTGTVLIPWSLALFFQGELRRGVGLLILYGAAALTRQALEPRLVGRQIGLDPLLTLMALYTGFRVVGVAGMILFPVGVIFLKQLWDHAGLAGNL